MNRPLTSCVVLALACAASDHLHAAESLSVTVEAGEHTRQRTPVSVVLPKTFEHQGKSLTLTRMSDDKQIPVQVNHAKPATLVWVVENLAAGQTQQYRLAAGAAQEPKPRAVCRDDGKRLVVEVKQKPALYYNHARVESPNKSEPYYGRSGYIHPLLTPSGRQVTGDFAADHPHQHGIMFAWTNTTFEKRPLNFWDQKQGTAIVEHERVEELVSGAVYAGFTSVIRHSDLKAPRGKKPVLTEKWQVSVFAIDDGFLFDLTSTQRAASKSPLRINKYHYGAMAIRGPADWLKPGAGDFLTSEGKTRTDGNHSRPRWCDLHGITDGAVSGVTIMSHPDNFRFPQPVRLHPSKPYFSFSPMVLGGFEISAEENYVSRFRYYVHDGALDVDRANRIWNDFAHPPEVTITSHSGNQDAR